jgi:transcriptional regulator with XRE-family HTH domain
MLTEKELGERLKNIREVRRISQFRLADMMGTEQSTIAKIEKGAGYPKLRADVCHLPR